MKKNKYITHILAFLTIVLFLCLNYSCTKFDENDSDIGNSSISKNLASDPLFEKLDEALYTSQLDAIKYRKEKIDQKLNQQVKLDIKNKRIKTYDEYCKSKEKAGYKDFAIRAKNKLTVSYYVSEIFKKYPDYDKREFAAFFARNRKHKIKREDLIENEFKNMYNEYYQNEK